MRTLVFQTGILASGTPSTYKAYMDNILTFL